MHCCPQFALRPAVAAVLARQLRSLGCVREGPVIATSADDVKLRNRLLALSPTSVRGDEAGQVARCAYTGDEISRAVAGRLAGRGSELFVNIGARKRRPLFSIYD